MQSNWWDGDYPITQGYGCTSYEGEPFNPNHPECPHFHDGMDIGLPCGRFVFAAQPGRVVAVGVYGGGPYALIVAVGEWWVWLFHLQANWVNQGDTFGPKQVLGEVGNLGFSTGCHLHFEVTPPNSGYFDSIDPSFMLAGTGQGGCALAPLAPLVGLTEVLSHALRHMA